MKATILWAAAILMAAVPASQAEMLHAQITPPAQPGAPPSQPVSPAQPATPAQPGAPVPQAAPAPQTKQTGMAAWSMLVGNTVTGRLDGREFADYYQADGTVKSMLDSQIVTGRWILDGDKVCFTYPDEPQECYGLEVSGDTATFTDKSGTGIRGQILKGNAKNL
ncbi:MAG: hypothetical protein KIT36_15480 [Alphaproteobacteria bacterium]|nr:hypothetical protein [Alphaproteobacteria bacterium]